MARAVAAKGYKAATVADVIKIARVSRKTFYEHFKDFEDCYLASYDAAVPILIERVNTAYNAVDGPWPEKIRAGLGAMAEFIAHEPDFARACIVEVLGAGPNAIARRDLVMRGLAAWFDSERGDVGGPISRPGLVAEMVVDGIYGVVYARLARGEEIDPDELAATITYLALFPYLGDASAREVSGLG
jgi:AcrR family transcriptional regulator